MGPSPRSPTARFGAHRVRLGDHIVADEDGAVLVAAKDAEEVLRMAQGIQARERTQAGLVRAGTSLRSQLRFREFLSRRAREPSFTFRSHLRESGGAIEEAPLALRLGSRPQA